jgi:hypothetical protein
MGHFIADAMNVVRKSCPRVELARVPPRGCFRAAGLGQMNLYRLVKVWKCGMHSNVWRLGLNVIQVEQG